VGAERSVHRDRLAAVMGASIVATAGLLLPAAGAGARTVTGSAPRMSAPVVHRPRANSPIRHVAVIYLENHSFDNILGYWCDQHQGRCPDGGMPSRVRLSDGHVVRPTVDPDTVPLVNHNVPAQLAAMNIVGGVPRMNGWQNIPSVKRARDSSCNAASGYQCISGYMPRQIPNLARLATSFAISDNTFSMGNSPSWGGHLYPVLASQDGFLGSIPQPKGAGPGWGCNSNKTTEWISPTGKKKSVPSCVPDFALNPRRYPFGGAFRATPVQWERSILDRLDAAGLSWRIYDGGGSNHPATDGWAICPSLADCWDTSQRHDMSGFTQFDRDAAHGTLPSFSVIIPGNVDGKYSEHNDLSMTAGDNKLGQLMTSIMNSPNWSSTAVFITYDDCGCFYDQGIPRRNPDGTWQGPRSPLVIVSPYARHSYTDTTHTTFAGILAFVEHNFRLAPLGPNDGDAYDFSNTFNYRQAPRRPVRMVIRPLPPSAKRIRITQAMLDDPT
jgi:phospholipase C